LAHYAITKSSCSVLVRWVGYPNISHRFYANFLMLRQRGRGFKPPTTHGFATGCRPLLHWKFLFR